MSFKFSWFCELLEDLEQSKYQQRATYAIQDDPSHRIVTAWFKKYNDSISRQGLSAIALLSALFPERRPDRTYNLQEGRLSHIFARVLLLGATRLRQLKAFKREDGADFATCIQQVMAEAEFDPPPPGREVTLEEIEVALTRIAATTVSSSPAIRAQATNESATSILSPIISRLRGREMKWIVRMILKSFKPIEIPEHAAMHKFHFMLPRVLAIQDSFEAAVAILSRPEVAKLPARPARDYENALLPFVMAQIRPQLGVMIKKQNLNKARSIKHCVKMAGSRTMSVERKYDGEYCQIHIDMSKGSKCVQIFSKSGRDSTEDRRELQRAIKAGLRLRKPDCKIKRHAILEGELLIYSRNLQQILPFHHVRKHVRHGGRRIGCEADSPKKAGEQLMIAFFDLLLLDDKIMINEPHENRQAYLKGLVSRLEGVSHVVERAIIDFTKIDATKHLRGLFARAIRKRWEGYVLKGLKDPYFSWVGNIQGIKLKKDYIGGLGDTADMCIVGGRRDVRAEAGLNLGQLRWTFFYVACLLNKDEVRRFSEKPIFKILDRIGPGNMSKDDILALNFEAMPLSEDFTLNSAHMTVQHPRRDFPVPTDIFIRPIVVEIMGAGFEKPQTVDYYTLRFPRRIGSNLKLHRDREIADTVSFDELQAMAQKSLTEEAEEGSQEDAEWVAALEDTDPKSMYILDESESTRPSKTPYSATTISISPASACRASTQPSPLIIRMDSQELTQEEWGVRYPNSVPQTPSRHSESTVSPVTKNTSEAVKRKLSFAEESPITGANSKKKRVAFDLNTGIRRTTVPRPLANMTNARRPSGVQPTSPSLNKSQSAKLYVSQLSRSSPDLRSVLKVLHIPKIVSAPCLPTPLSTDDGPQPSAQITNRPANTTKKADALLHKPRSDMDMLHTVPDMEEETVMYQVRPPGAPYTNAIIDQLFRPPTNRVQVRTPIWIAPSVRADHEADRYARKALMRNFTGYTQSLGTFVEYIKRSPALNWRAFGKYLVFIDAAVADLAAADLKRAGDEITMRDMANLIKNTADVLVFDYRIMHTKFAEWDFDVSRDSEELDLAECEEWFCGILELILARTEQNSGKEVYGVKLNLDVTAREALTRDLVS